MRYHRTPIVGEKTWTIVMNAAGWRCQCAGECGSRHAVRPRDPQERCRLQQPHADLIVAPSILTLTDTQAARTPVSDLRVWCGECRRKALARQRKEARVASREEVTALPTLF